jgi:hypothetical protein
VKPDRTRTNNIPKERAVFCNFSFMLPDELFQNEIQGLYPSKDVLMTLLLHARVHLNVIYLSIHPSICPSRIDIGQPIPAFYRFSILTLRKQLFSMSTLITSLPSLASFKSRKHRIQIEYSRNYKEG